MAVNDIYFILVFSMIFINNINDLYINKIYKNGVKDAKPKGKYSNYIMMMVMLSIQWSVMIHIPIFIFSIVYNIDLYEPIFSLLLGAFGKTLFSMFINDTGNDTGLDVHISEYVWMHIASIIVAVTVFTMWIFV